MVVLQRLHKDRHHRLILQHPEVARRHASDPMLLVAQCPAECVHPEFFERRDNRFKPLDSIGIALGERKRQFKLFILSSFPLEGSNQPNPLMPPCHPPPDLSDHSQHDQADG